MKIKEALDEQLEVNKYVSECIINLSAAITNLTHSVEALDKRISMLEKDKSSLILPKGVN